MDGFLVLSEITDQKSLYMLVQVDDFSSIFGPIQSNTNSNKPINVHLNYLILNNIWAGSQINLGDLIYEPPRDGPTLWEIGIPDRSAAEFFVPDPKPEWVNKLYVDHPDRLHNSLLSCLRITLILFYAT